MHAERSSPCRLVAVLIAAVLASPAIGQPTTLIERTPGTVSAQRAETASATVTAIDLATRQVTLRRDDGNTLTVFAGPNVRNLPQLRVGDTVTIDFYNALTLELRKGGTGAPASRADIVSGSRAELGQRPGGITSRETVIVADVVAVNVAGQTVSLRGPGGRVVVLPIRDPEQFKRIAVGDQVEATYVEAAALSITPAPTPAAAAAPAMTWGRWMIGARALNIDPDVSSSVSGFAVKDQWTGELDTHLLLHAERRGRGQHHLVEARRQLQGQQPRQHQDDAGNVHAPISLRRHRPRSRLRTSSRTSAAASTIRTSTRETSAATPGHLSAVTAGAGRYRRASTTSSSATGTSTWTSSTSGLTMT